jgi:hypothetical protein
MCGELYLTDMNPRPGRTTGQPSAREITLNAWHSFVTFIVPFAFDAIIGLAILGAFLLFSWVIGLARVAGMGRQSYLDAFEALHGWLNLGVYSIVGLSFLLRIIRRIFRGE